MPEQTNAYTSREASSWPLFPSSYLAVSMQVLFVAFAITIGLAIRTVWFHPLSRFPGPKLWAASRIPYVVSLLRGTLNQHMLEFHQKHGDIIRIAPNELSFGTEDAWKDIYAYRPGHKEVTKDPQWYWAPNDMPQNVVTTTDLNVRARMRRLLSPSFSAQALRDQSPAIESYSSACLNQLKRIEETQSLKKQVASVNMLDWINFYTIDVIGDLALGESFHCLEGSDYHPWVRTLFNFLKGMVIASAVRFFPAVEYLFTRMIPKEIVQKQKEHTLFTNAKILQRLESQSKRPDFMTPFLKDMATRSEKMSIGEIQSTFAIVIVAGSETTATSLLGTLFKLATHPKVQQKLYEELSSRFHSEDEINVSSTSNIPYLDGCINEGLRLCFAVPGGLPRLSPPGGDFFAGEFIPEGTAISIRPSVVLQDERYFTRSHEFIPERWLASKDEYKKFANDRLSASQPFSVGPTACLGKPLAWAEMRLIVARIVWYFQLSMTEGKLFRWEDQRMMMIVEKNPLWMDLQRRS